MAEKRRMTWIASLGFALALLFGSAPHTGAVVTGDNETAKSNPVDENPYSSFEWDYVYPVYTNGSLGSGVAVYDNWLLTADHVGSGNIEIDDTTYTVQETVSHAEADLLLIRYDQVFPGYYPLYTGEHTLPPPPQAQKGTGLIVGYGLSGEVNEEDNTYSMKNDTAGTKRWGDSLIDAQGEGIEDQEEIYKTDYIRLDFDTDATEYAAGVAFGDSGGGVFIEDNEEWYLAGTSIMVIGEEDAYTGSIAADLTVYEPWVMNVVPEPGTGASFLIGAWLLWIDRRRRR